MAFEPSAQRHVFRLQLGKTLMERVDRRGDLLFGEARSDVLLAVPVEGLKPQPEDPL